MPKVEDNKRTIGPCTLYLGDCLEVLKSFPDKCVDCVVTDPPYGHNNNDGDLIHNREAALGIGPAGKSRPIENDGAEANEVFKDSLPTWLRLLPPGGCCCCCCCGGGGPDPQFARWSMWLDEVFDFKQMIVWDKGPMGMGWHYRRSYETVLVGQKPGAKCKWHDETNAVENVIRPSHGIRKILPLEDQHPTEKPWQLKAHFVKLHTLPGEIVLDPFMGSGSTGIACLRTGRKFIGIEKDPRWYNHALGKIANEWRQMNRVGNEMTPHAPAGNEG